MIVRKGQRKLFGIGGGLERGKVDLVDQVGEEGGRDKVLVVGTHTEHSRRDLVVVVLGTRLCCQGRVLGLAGVISNQRNRIEVGPGQIVTQLDPRDLHILHLFPDVREVGLNGNVKASFNILLGLLHLRSKRLAVSL